MRNCLVGNHLRSMYSRSSRRSGFSLAELVVSIGVLVLMLALAGEIFSLTVKSSGQATALTKVSQLMRAFERTLRADLAGVHPGQSLILIQGNPVNAFWTPEAQEAAGAGTLPSAGYSHAPDPVREDDSGKMASPRADVLMFFTARRETSFTNPDVTSNLQQVTYAHATIGEWVNADPAAPPPAVYAFQRGPVAFPAGPAEYPDRLVVPAVTADQWHLTRRSVLLLPAAPPPPSTADDPRRWANATAPDPNALEQNRRLRQGETDVMGNFDLEQFVLAPGTPPPWYLPVILDDTAPTYVPPYARTFLDPQPPASQARTLGAYLIPNCASFKVEWTLDPHSDFVAGRLDRAREVFWFDPGDNGDPDDPSDYGDPLRTLQEARNVAPDDSPLQRDLECLLGTTASPQTPAKLCPAEVHSDGTNYTLSERFRTVTITDNPASWLALAKDGRPNLVVFGAARQRPGTGPGGGLERVEEDIFPGALRITIDLYDRGRRLERPLRHVIVVPVGG